MKLKCFQINVIRSKKILLPCFGDGGRINIAGNAISSLQQAASVATNVHNTAAAVAMTAYDT